MKFQGILNKLGLYTRGQFQGAVDTLTAKNNELCRECNNLADSCVDLNLTIDRLLPKGSSADMVAATIAALLEVGVKEIKGSKHNERIIEYHKATELQAKDDETAWCSAFANFVLKSEGIKATDKANARSFLAWGVPSEGNFGDVVIFWRGSKNSWQGHVGFVIARRNGYVYTLGGNQKDQVCISAEPEDRVLGFRRLK